MGTLKKGAPQCQPNLSKPMVARDTFGLTVIGLIFRCSRPELVVKLALTYLPILRGWRHADLAGRDPAPAR
jgi:hypothetical protein